MTGFRSKLIWLILVSSLVRICLSFATQLGNVEAYYWSWSLRPQWNYVDHPPMVAWMIAATTFKQTFVNECTVRLGAIIASTICTWLSYLTGKKLLNSRAGWYAAVMYTTCVFTSALVGNYVLPDSPQLVFWLSSIYVLVSIAQMPAGDKRVGWYWMLFGVLTGLCIMSKMHGVFIGLGAFLYCLFCDRSQFAKAHFYVAVLITLFIISPIAYWNIRHDWYMFRFQAPRFTISGGMIDIKRTLMHGLAIILAVGPVHFFLVWKNIIVAAKDGFKTISKPAKAILFCGVPMIVFLTVVSIFREVYVHWPGPAYAGLLVLPACTIAGRIKNANVAFPKIFGFAALYCLLFMLLQPAVINFLPGTTSKEKEGIQVGRNDITVDMVGWKEAGIEYRDYYTASVRNKTIHADIPVIIASWVQSGAIEFYMVRRTGQMLLGVSGLDSLHQYYFVNQGRRLQKGEDAIYIVTSNHLDMQVMEKVSAHFDSVANVVTTPVYRANLLCKQTFVFLLKNYDGKDFELR